MAAKLPPPLKSGDTIGIMAPSSRIEPADLQAAADLLTARGYKVFIHPQSLERLNQSAGTADQKTKALHDLVRDPAIKAIFFATGGNRAMTMLDHLDDDLIKKFPKIYMGFSDCTLLLNAITARTGLVTYHGPTLRRLLRNPQIDFNLRLLAGAEKSIPLTGARYLREGNATGTLIGGNLSLLRYLVNTKDMADAKGSILFLEDIGEELSRIDRDFCYLRRCGLFDDIGALLLGQFTDLRDCGTPFGFTFEDTVREYTDGLRIPVLIDAPFGHDTDLYALPIGQTATLADAVLTLENLP